MTKLWQQMAMPVSGQIEDMTEPATDYVTFNDAAIRPLAANARDFGQWYFLWCNRAQSKYNPKPNKGLYTYPTIERANFATIAQMRAATISQVSGQQVADNNNLQYVTAGDTEALADLWDRPAYTIWIDGEKYYRNVVVLPTTIVSYIDGVVLDYEVQDGRTPATTKNFITRLNDECPLDLHLYTNPIGSGGYNSSGLVGNERYLYSILAGLPIHAFGDDKSGLKIKLFDDVRKYGGAAKCYVIYELGTNRPQHSVIVRDFVNQRNLLGVNIWRNGTNPDTAENTAEINRFYNAWA